MCYIFGFNHFLAEVLVEKSAMMCSKRALQLKGIDDSETNNFLIKGFLGRVWKVSCLVIVL